jgi:aminopeptidase
MRKTTDPRRLLARVAVSAAIPVEDGSLLRVTGEHPHRELMYMVAEEAYRRGARLVRIDYSDIRLGRIRVDHSRDEHVEAVSALLENESEILVSEGWSLLRIEGYESATVMEGADPSRLMRMQRARGKAVTALRKAQMASRLAWSVIPAATDAWAAKVFGPGASTQRLWDTLIPILRLDAQDPAAELLAHMEALEGRGRRLTALELRSIRFWGPGTDLRISLSPHSQWLGGGDRLPTGRLFMPNLPTEEIFTTPDYRGVEGHFTTTRPARIHGTTVEEARIEFRGGEVVSTAARCGADALARLLETDAGARRLGEVALVDITSPIWRSGLVFDSMLLDENAACHVALGSGYDLAMGGAQTWSDAEKESHGFNVSYVHEDLMIGSEEVSVTGEDAAGRERQIIREGRFCL